MTRRELLAAIAPAGWAACSAGQAGLDFDAPRRRALAEGVAYLHARQRPDGAWRSETYGLLAGGDSLTAFVADALATVDPPDPHVAGALAFLRGRISPAGALGMTDPGLPDYPSYSTALTLKTLIATEEEGGELLVGHLLSRQFSEADGWAPDSAPYGAWGMGGAVRRPPRAGHVDLSMTRHVLEALSAAGLGPEHPAFRRARVYVERCRNADGGFHFSTVVDEANKAGRRAGGWLSYGTATADGIRAAEAIGLETRCARQWLILHHLPSAVPGFENHPDVRWKDGLWYYYAASAAPFLNSTQRRALAAELIDRQRADGSWASSEPLVKEDDPLIATAMAVRALRARPR